MVYKLFCCILWTQWTNQNDIKAGYQILVSQSNLLKMQYPIVIQNNKLISHGITVLIISQVKLKEIPLKSHRDHNHLKHDVDADSLMAGRWILVSELYEPVILSLRTWRQKA